MSKKCFPALAGYLLLAPANVFADDSATTSTSDFSFYSDAAIVTRVGIDGTLVNNRGLATEADSSYDRSYMRFEGTVGFDVDFGTFIVSPRITSFGANTLDETDRAASQNELLPYVDVSFGKWTLSLGDVQGRPLPVANGVLNHTTIETRPVYSYFATRQDGQVENFAPLIGYADNTRQSSPGKIALSYDDENWFVRGIADLGLVKDTDHVADAGVTREYYRLEGGFNTELNANTHLRLGAAIWHQDSFENTNGRIADPVTLSKSAVWGNGADGIELAAAIDFGKLDIGLSGTMIEGPYSDGINASNASDKRTAVHFSTAYQFDENWSVAGTYSDYSWELTNNAALGRNTGDLLQIGVQYEVNENFSMGLGYVRSTSSAWSGGARSPNKSEAVVFGTRLSF